MIDLEPIFNNKPETGNTTKLIDYIDGAKDWLDKAKTEYNQANPVGGELILNLAQAEIKYAWELSRSNYVSDSMKSAQTQQPVRKREYRFKPMLSAAASIIIIIAGFGWWLIAGPSSVKNGPVLTDAPGTRLQEKVIEPGRNQNTILTEKPSPADKTTGGQLALGNQPVPVNTEPQTSLTAVQTDRNRQSVKNTTFASQTRTKENPAGQSNLQPVSKLVIDEEALAREASHSLRNGK